MLCLLVLLVSISCLRLSAQQFQGDTYFTDGMEVDSIAKFNFRVGVGINPTWALDIFSTTKTFHMETSYADGGRMEILELKDTTIVSPRVGNVNSTGMILSYQDTIDAVTLTSGFSITRSNVPNTRFMTAQLGVSSSTSLNSLQINNTQINLELQTLGIEKVSMTYGDQLFGAGVTGFQLSYNPDTTAAVQYYVTGSDINSGSIQIGGGAALAGGDGTNISFTPTAINLSNTQTTTTSLTSGATTGGFTFNGADGLDGSSMLQLTNSTSSFTHRFANDGEVFFGGNLNMTGNVLPTDTIFDLGTSSSTAFWDDLYVKKINASDFLSIIGSAANRFETIFGTVVNAPFINGGQDASDNLTLESTGHATKGDILLGATADMQLIFDGATGNVGIGIAPTTRLHVDNNAADTEAIITLENTGGNIQKFIGIQDPNGVITGSMGDEFTDYINGVKYFKQQGTATNTGWEVLGGIPTIKSYALANNGTAGTFYVGGFYDAPAADVTLTIGGSVTQTLGTAGQGWAAHAFIVASGAGCADCVVTVTGISITDAGVKNGADSEIVIPDADELSTNQYLETTKKWLGQVTYTLTGAAGAVTFNYGYEVHDDFGSREFIVTDFEVTGEMRANETGMNIELLHHEPSAFIYSAAAFVPNATPVISLATDHGTDGDDVASGNNFSYKRTMFSEDILGNDEEGTIIRVTLTGNNTANYMNIHLSVLIE